MQIEIFKKKNDSMQYSFYLSANYPELQIDIVTNPSGLRSSEGLVRLSEGMGAEACTSYRTFAPFFLPD